MLTGVVEGGKVRCCRYWPDAHASQEWGKYEVHNVSEQADRIYITRNLKLRNRMVRVGRVGRVGRVVRGEGGEGGE